VVLSRVEGVEGVEGVGPNKKASHRRVDPFDTFLYGLAGRRVHGTEAEGATSVEALAQTYVPILAGLPTHQRLVEQHMDMKDAQSYMQYWDISRWFSSVSEYSAAVVYGLMAQASKQSKFGINDWIRWPKSLARARRTHVRLRSQAATADRASLPAS
jgi:hypothetical protein